MAPLRTSTTCAGRRPPELGNRDRGPLISVGALLDNDGGHELRDVPVDSENPIRSGRGIVNRAGGKQTPQTLSWYAERSPEHQHRESLAAVGGAPDARQFVGLAPADPEHPGGLLDGQRLGEIVQGEPWPFCGVVRLGLRHDGNVTPASALCQLVPVCSSVRLTATDESEQHQAMVRKRASQDESPKAEAPPLYWGLTPNQVVGYNLARARQWKGWTQEETADALAPYLGTRWSKASVSQAERSVAGKFVRNFNADEIVAFARAFNLPVTWFFMPPSPRSDIPGVPVKLSTPDAERIGTQLALLIDLVFGDDQQQALLTLALDGFLGQVSQSTMTVAQGRVESLARRRVEALARHSYRDLEDWKTALRAVANQLETLELQSKRAAAEDLGIDQSALPLPPQVPEDDDEWEI